MLGSSSNILMLVHTHILSVHQMKTEKYVVDHDAWWKYSFGDLIDMHGYMPEHMRLVNSCSVC